MPNISQHPWKCAWMTTSLRPQREPNDSTFMTSDYRATELQSFKTRTSKARYENLEHCESQLKAIFDTFQFLVMGKDQSKDENATTENKDHSQNQDT